MDVEYTEFDDVPKIKIVFLGDRSVGKSSIVKRFIRDEFDVLQNVRSKTNLANNRNRLHEQTHGVPREAV